MTYADLCDLAGQHVNAFHLAYLATLITASLLIGLPVAWQRWRA